MGTGDCAHLRANPNHLCPRIPCRDADQRGSLAPRPTAHRTIASRMEPIVHWSTEHETAELTISSILRPSPAKGPNRPKPTSRWASAGRFRQSHFRKALHNTQLRQGALLGNRFPNGAEFPHHKRQSGADAAFPLRFSKHLSRRRVPSVWHDVCM